MRVERVKARKAGRQHAVIGHRRLGEQDRARFAQTRGGRGVGGGGRQIVRRRADRARLALGGDVVLDGGRHAVERPHRLALRPARFRGAGVGERALGREQISGVDMRLELRDPIEHVAHRFDRRESALAVGVEQRDGAHLMGTHGVSGLALRAAGRLAAPPPTPPRKDGEGSRGGSPPRLFAGRGREWGSRGARLLP